jgi:hypothetical protein
MRRAKRTPDRATRSLLAIAAAALAVCATGATASTAERSTQPTQAADQLPEASVVFERYIEAIGGRDAMAKIKNRRIEGTYTGDPFEFKANLQIWWEEDGRYHSRINEPAGLKYDLYAVDRMTWSNVMDRGPEPMGGVQRQELLDTSDFWGEANYEKRYKEIKVLREATAGETVIYIVQAMTHAGRPHTLYFAKDTGLLIGTRVPVSGPKNTARDMTVQILDYKDFGGVLYPTKFVQKFNNEPNTKHNVFVYTSIKINAEDAHEYPVPDTVRELFEKAAQEGAPGD